MCTLDFTGETDQEVDQVSCRHKSTFNALASVQEAKKNRKYVTCNAGADLSVLSDCLSLVHIYKHSTPTDIIADMHVVTLPEEEDPKKLGLSEIHGIHITPGGDVLVLRRGSFYVLRANSMSD